MGQMGWDTLHNLTGGQGLAGGRQEADSPKIHI